MAYYFWRALPVLKGRTYPLWTFPHLREGLPKRKAVRCVFPRLSVQQGLWQPSEDSHAGEREVNRLTLSSCATPLSICLKANWLLIFLTVVCWDSLRSTCGLGFWAGGLWPAYPFHLRKGWGTLVEGSQWLRSACSSGWVNWRQLPPGPVPPASWMLCPVPSGQTPPFHLRRSRTPLVFISKHGLAPLVTANWEGSLTTRFIGH